MIETASLIENTSRKSINSAVTRRDNEGILHSQPSNNITNNNINKSTANQSAKNVLRVSVNRHYNTTARMVNKAHFHTQRAFFAPNVVYFDEEEIFQQEENFPTD